MTINPKYAQDALVELLDADASSTVTLTRSIIDPDCVEVLEKVARKNGIKINWRGRDKCQN